MKRALGDGYELDDDRDRIDRDAVHAFLSKESYWAVGRSRAEVQRLIDGAERVVGLYKDGEQIGFTRTVTDDASIAYLADVYVLSEHRGRGLGLELLKETIDRGPYAARRWILHTADATGLYQRVGFGPPTERLMERPAFGIVAATDAEIPLVRELFLEYAASLDFDLCFQGFDQELESLPGNYAPPSGRILLARRGDELLGCAAVKAVEAAVTGELKRLWVRPSYRGQGVGRALTLKAADVARALGYHRLVLDTLVSMTEANGLYRSLGFKEIDPYTYNPMPEATYLALDLV